MTAKDTLFYLKCAAQEWLSSSEKKLTPQVALVREAIASVGQAEAHLNMHMLLIADNAKLRDMVRQANLLQLKEIAVNRATGEPVVMHIVSVNGGLLCGEHGMGVFPLTPFSPELGYVTCSPCLTKMQAMGMS